MPVYNYHCEKNGESIEVEHSIKDKLKTWGELCAMANRPLGKTPANTPIERLLYASFVSTPAGNSKLKEMGFTKLVKRDKGVYENVTATGTEKKFMTAGDASSMPHIHKKVSD